MTEKLEFNGTLCDAWGSNGTFFIMFNTNEFDPEVLPDLYDLAKRKVSLTLKLDQNKETTLSIDGQLPIKISDPMGKEPETEG